MKFQNSLRMKLALSAIAAGVFLLLPTRSLAAPANCEVPSAPYCSTSETYYTPGQYAQNALPASQFYGGTTDCGPAGYAAGSGCGVHGNRYECDLYGNCDAKGRGDCETGYAARDKDAKYADCRYGKAPYDCPNPAICGSADCQREACSKVCAQQGFCDCSEAVCESNACKSLRGRQRVAGDAIRNDAACPTAAACELQPEVTLPDAAQPLPTARPTAAPAVTPKPTARPTAKPTAEPTTTPTPTDDSHYTRTTYAAQEAELLNYVNLERANYGLEPLVVSEKLTEVARIKSWDMSDNRYFDHQSPTLGGMKDLLKSQGVAYSAAGENIAHYGNIYKAHNALMASEGHRRNILSSAYTQIGIGIATDPNGNYLITEEFLRP